MRISCDQVRRRCLLFDANCLDTDQRGVDRTTDCETGAAERTTDRVATPIFHDGFLQGDTEAWSPPN